MNTVNASPSRHNWFREVFSTTWQSKRMWLLHVTANGALMLLVYLFLVLPDRTVVQVFASALLAAVVVCAILWLHGATFVYFSDVHETHSARFRDSLGMFGPRIPAALAWLIGVGVLLGLWMKVDPWLLSVAGLMRQKSSTLRGMFTVKTMDRIVEFKFFVVWAIILPIVSLPLFAGIARRGFGGWAGQGWRGVGRALKNWRWWVTYVILFVIGAWVPYKLAYWIPEASTLGKEFASMLARLAFAYLLAVTGWLLVVSAVTWFTRDEHIPAAEEREVAKA